ncbi:MAG: hypothetical protein NZZ41_08130 [Candidatus Dojkabacteria bacterium]|nr:hypothetical protein [Candidatus Dojkabacteria bacterium]
MSWDESLNEKILKIYRLNSNLDHDIKCKNICKFCKVILTENNAHYNREKNKFMYGKICKKCYVVYLKFQQIKSHLAKILLKLGIREDIVNEIIEKEKELFFKENCSPIVEESQKK